MGDCGCGDFAADYKIPGPEGIIYAIQVYLPCKNCDTAASVIVHRFSVTEAKMWGADDLPDLEFMKMNGEVFDGAPAMIEVLHPRKLKARMVSFAKRHGKKYEPEGLVQDAVDRTLFDAICDTLGEPVEEGDEDDNEDQDEEDEDEQEEEVDGEDNELVDDDER